MNPKFIMRAIEYARDGMYVPPELTKEMVKRIKAKKDKSFLVLFSYEMLPVLNDLGYKDVTLALDKPRKSIYNVAKYYGYKIVDLKEIKNMKFHVVIGNPPYQFKKNADKKGKSGDNSLYIKFINLGIDVLKPNGILSFVTPPAALIKSTTFGEPTETMKKMLDEGSLKYVDLTAKNHFNVGTHIASWMFVKGKKQNTVLLKTNESAVQLPISDIYYLPPTFDDVEIKLYEKIISNKVGKELKVIRIDDKMPSNMNDYIMMRFGYPKIVRAKDASGPQALSFGSEFGDFMLSPLGLWLLDYVRRHDQMIYHKLLTGIRIPDSGFKLTKDEKDFINSREWRNFGVSK
jgi:hypothetical protein